MASDARSSSNGVLDVSRSGKFADYNQLRCYYVGLGGNTNTTTRFRRYIGSKDDRPLLPEHDLSDPQFLLKPNVTQKIQLVAFGSLIQYWRNGKKLFELNDAQPYTRGWFALRTTKNHMAVQNFRVLRLMASGSTAPIHLSCEYKENPLGLMETRPRFSWWLNDERRGEAQTAYQITVGSSPDKSDIWDSGKVSSDQSVNVEYNGSPLSSAKQCFWRVKVWDQDGVESPWSQTQTFETGLLDPSDWHAKWIGSNLAGSMNTSVPAPMLRKTLTLPRRSPRRGCTSRLSDCSTPRSMGSTSAMSCWHGVHRLPQAHRVSSVRRYEAPSPGTQRDRRDAWRRLGRRVRRIPGPAAELRHRSAAAFGAA